MIKIATSMLFAVSVTSLSHADPHDVFGTFLTEAGTSHVKIADCGDGTPCGTIAWIDPASMQPGMTPESAKTKTGDPVLGLVMLQGFDQKKKDWRSGTIYDPEADKSYAARLKRLDSGALELKGCVGPICQTQIWQTVATAEDAE